jgi:hypothetical protein
MTMAGDPAPYSRMAMDSWIVAYADAWRSKDAEALADLFVADARYFS